MTASRSEAWPQSYEKRQGVGSKCDFAKRGLQGTLGTYNVAILHQLVHHRHAIEDIWIDGKTLKNRFPRIYSLESCKLITVGAKLAQPSLEYSFRRNPRGGVEQDQFNELSALVHDVSLIPMSDRWKWDLESSGDFSVASVRKIIDDKSLSDVDSKTRGIDIDFIMCVICDNGVETSRHLFFYCCMARQIVRKITRWWDVPYVEAESYEDWYNWLVNLQISSMHKQMFEGVFYVMW
ncbi:hypothetical protein Tco_0962255 [Tanacetum coccineum]